MKLKWDSWLYSMWKAVVGGVAATSGAYMATLVGNQITKEIPVMNWQSLGFIVAFSAVSNLFFYLQKAPAPEDVDAAPPKLPLLLVGFCILHFAFCISFTGCAAVKPGNDPLVVRTEQFLTTAQGTFLLTLQVDNVDRGYWRKQAPAFHAFCEELRAPTPYQITNTLPRYRVALLSLDDVKRDYQQARTSSNALFTALTTLQSLTSQAGAWLTIVTNRTN